MKILITSLIFPIPWAVIFFFKLHLSPYFLAIFSGIAIFGGAYLLATAAEIAEQDIPKSFALAILALIAVLPEYIVDFYFAWMAPKRPEYASYALANMTGANRLLIGIGWPLIFILFYLKNKKKKFLLPETLSLEIGILFIATLISFFIIFFKHLSLIHSIPLLFIFFFYLYKSTKGKTEEKEPVGYLKIFFKINKRKRWLILSFLFIYSTFSILISGHAFGENLVKTGKLLKISEFLLVQWIAPLASESPEVIILSIYTLKQKENSAFHAIVSSKINQWSLLIGSLPIVAIISALSLYSIPIDLRQKEEILLTAAQSFFAVILLCDFKFDYKDAILLFTLFFAQFVFPSVKIRLILSIIYIFLGIILLLSKNKRRKIKEIIQAPFK